MYKLVSISRNASETGLKIYIAVEILKVIIYVMIGFVLSLIKYCKEKLQNLKESLLKLINMYLTHSNTQEIQYNT